MLSKKCKICLLNCLPYPYCMDGFLFISIAIPRILQHRYLQMCSSCNVPLIQFIFIHIDSEIHYLPSHSYVQESLISYCCLHQSVSFLVPLVQDSARLVSINRLHLLLPALVRVLQRNRSIRIYLYISMSIFVYVYICIIYMYLYICVCAYLYICIYLYLCMYLCVCLYERKRERFIF